MSSYELRLSVWSSDFCPSDLDGLVKHRRHGPGGIVGTRLTYSTHPFDVVGWDGCLYPYTFNIEDYMPITGKVHQPPPVHQVFEGNTFVFCTFVPRKVDYHPIEIGSASCRESVCQYV